MHLLCRDPTAFSPGRRRGRELPLPRTHTLRHCRQACLLHATGREHQPRTLPPKQPHFAGTRAPLWVWAAVALRACWHHTTRHTASCNAPYHALAHAQALVGIAFSRAYYHTRTHPRAQAHTHALASRRSAWPLRHFAERLAGALTRAHPHVHARSHAS